jgi:hypothetical protein
LRKYSHFFKKPGQPPALFDSLLRAYRQLENFLPLKRGDFIKLSINPSQPPFFEERYFADPYGFSSQEMRMDMPKKPM